ncbi:peptidoglycan/LPS O-acetylase OafA/YrhL [Rhodococcus sp. 27YEA15]|uniref:hypothetical protein n=1 Tax=Rhodococcus sp. 27YEA15 TaxID=3156259 RepID=UPI003C7CFA81
MPESNVLTRYQDYRTRRFLKGEADTRHMLPRWRTRHRRRILVVTLGVLFTAMVVASTACLFFPMAALAWPVISFMFLPVWTSLQLVSGRQGDAPKDALDEWEIQQRNEARSIGLTVTQTLVLIVALFLIFASVLHWNIERLGYAGGVLALSAMLIGACTPAMILGWTRPDIDPSDIEPSEN